MITGIEEEIFIYEKGRTSNMGHFSSIYVHTYSTDRRSTGINGLRNRKISTDVWARNFGL